MGRLAASCAMAGSLLAGAVATAGCAIGAEPGDETAIGGTADGQRQIRIAQADGEGRRPGGLGAYLAGLHAAQVNDNRAAADLMAVALSRDPGNVQLLHRTLILFALEGRIADARKLSERMVQVAPKHSIANLILGVTAALRDDLDAAETALKRLPLKEAEALTRPLLMAWLAAARGDAEQAKSLVAPLLQLQGFEPLVQLHRGMLFELADRPLMAMAAYEAAIAANERTSLRIVLRAGRYFEREGLGDRALAFYRGYAAENPNSALIGLEISRMQRGEAPPPVHSLAEGLGEALFNISSLLNQDNADDKALIYGHLALTADPGMEVSQVLIAEVLQSQGRSRAAIAAFEQLRDSEAFGFAAAVNIASELHDLGDTVEAEQRLRMLGERYPDRYGPYLRIGNMLRTEERFAEAAEAYAEAIARLGQPEPHHWTLFYFRGIALEQSDQWESAEQSFLRALELQPKQPYVMNYLAYSWVEQKTNLEQAQQMLREAVEQEPDDGYIVDSLGWVYYRLAKYDEAVEMLERAVELRPQDPVINDHLGDAYWRTGRKREARVQWQRALSLDPEGERIEGVEEKLRRGLDAANPIAVDAKDT